MRRGEQKFQHWSGPISIQLGDEPRSEAERRESSRILSTLLFDFDSGDASVGRLLEGLHRQLFPRKLGRRERAVPEHLRRDLEAAVAMDLLVLRPRRLPSISVQSPGQEGSFGPAETAEEALTFFEARFVDEIGEGISGLSVVLTAAGKRHEATTDGSGLARFDDIETHFATLRVSDPSALADIVEPRWEQLRSGQFPTGEPRSVFRLTDDFSSIGLSSEVEHLVVITPELGRIFVELFDKTGRFRHAEVDYTIEGPMSFSGTTNEFGQLSHDEVLPGEYKLKFTLEFFEGSDAVRDEYETPLVVLDAGDGVPQTRMIGAVPRVVMSRLGGLLFETNKNFLLPNSLHSLSDLVQVYHDNPHAKLLVVGHTDTMGDPGYNDPLSIERAESVAAYLADDVDYWLGRYASSVPSQKRWGAREDLLMLHSLPDFDPESDEDEVRAFQTSRGLTVDGIAGPQTRRQLITEYMDFDGTTLPETIEVTVHGCGENFPVDETGAALDEAPADSSEDILDRRVELFFFDPEFGILPKPPGKNSKKSDPQYPAWRDAAEREARRVGESKLVSQIHAQLLTEDGQEPIEEAEVEVQLPDRAHLVVSSESGIVFVSAAPAGDFEAVVRTEDGREGTCHLLSNNLRERARQVRVQGISAPPAELADNEIEIQVVNEDGSPAAGMHYELSVSPDEVRRGVTDEHGFVFESELSTTEVSLVLTSPFEGEEDTSG